MEALQGKPLEKRDGQLPIMDIVKIGLLHASVQRLMPSHGTHTVTRRCVVMFTGGKEVPTGQWTERNWGILHHVLFDTLLGTAGGVLQRWGR